MERMNEVFNTVCYTLSDALIWLIIGGAWGYAFKEWIYELKHKKRGGRRHDLRN